jgi:hypothetical protein
MRKRSLQIAAVLALGLLPVSSAQDTSADSSEQPPRFGLALGVGSLGIGIQAATGVARHTNIRGGFNYFSYGLSDVGSNNLTYNGTLRFESGEILVDQYLKGPFHISGGALIYNGLQATGNLNVPSGQSFTLNHVTYYSAASDPVTGTGKITVNQFAPEVLIGFGNLLPRGAHHFSVNVDLGVAFQGSPKAQLNLLGSVCNAAATGCFPITSNPVVQANIIAEQGRIADSLSPLEFYPILRVSFGYKF